MRATSAPGSWFGTDVLVVSPTPTHPQDHGNRKRIFQICRKLKENGARIHFVHYASELEWRRGRPKGAEREMNAAWDSYHLVAPSRPLHEKAVQRDHTIDEWADVALTGYIRWAFSIRKYDAVIVNYTWMSFCFEAVPKGVFKILDTHDVFAGRRLMLEANGIKPEFFHTTESEEAIAIARADLVWAIKPSEQVYFERLGAKNCITILHAEPEHECWTSPPSSDGWLRVGVIGARNNVNRRNLELFLAEALPVFEKYAAPVKIIIAGGCADDFVMLVHPNIEIAGRVADIDDFYRMVDVVAAPMRFSTGLKIKVAEAFASGAPLISHAHATEGYPTVLSAHTLPSFEAMALEIVKLAFDPSGLVALAQTSHRANAEIQKDVLAALEQSRELLRLSEKSVLLVITPMSAFSRDSLLFDHLCAVTNYMKSAADIVFYMVGPAAKIDRDIVRERGLETRILVERELARELGDDLPEGWIASTLESAIETRNVQHAYFLCSVPGLRALQGLKLRRAYLRYDAITLSGDDPFALIDSLQPIAQLAVLSARVDGLDDLLRRRGVTDVRQVPYLRANRFEGSARRGSAQTTGELLVLTSVRDASVDALTVLAKRLLTDALVVDTNDSDAQKRFARPVGRSNPVAIDMLAIRLVVDLTEGDAFAGVVSEGFLRAGIPVVTVARGLAGASLRNTAHLARPASMGRLLTTVARGLRDGAFRASLENASSKEVTSLTKNDSGWTWLHRDFDKTKNDSSGSAAAELFA